jgi:hypothetical protein
MLLLRLPTELRCSTVGLGSAILPFYFESFYDRDIGDTEQLQRHSFQIGILLRLALLLKLLQHCIA